MENESNGCERCPVATAMERRDFVREALARSLGAIGALSALSSTANALPMEDIRGRGPRAAKSYPIPATDAVAIDKDESVIVARVGDRVYAFSLACPHQNTALRWEEKNHRFQCPKHKSRYQPDGVFIEGRATRGLDRFAVTRDGTQLVVDLDRLYRQDKNAAEWSTAFVTLGEK